MKTPFEMTIEELNEFITQEANIVLNKLFERENIEHAVAIQIMCVAIAMLAKDFAAPIKEISKQCVIQLEEAYESLEQLQ